MWVVIVAVVLCIAVFVFWIRRGNVDSLKPSVELLDIVAVQGTVLDPQTLRGYTIRWNGKTFALLQRCTSGDVQRFTTVRADVQNEICIGMNRLILSYQSVESYSLRETTLDETSTMNPSGAPALYGASVDAAGILTIDYAIDSCVMFGECASSSTPHNPILFDLATMKLIPS